MAQRPNERRQKSFTHLNTLSSTVKPSFRRPRNAREDSRPPSLLAKVNDKDIVVLSSPSVSSDGHSECLGDSSDLFEGNTGNSIMVNERSPATPAPGKPSSSIPPGESKKTAPEFGKPTQLRSPHRKDEYAHFFLPRNHQTSKPFRPPPPISSEASSRPVSTKCFQPNIGQRREFRSGPDNDLVEIPKPANFPLNVPRPGERDRPHIISNPTLPVYQTIHSAPQPSFSTKNPGTNSYLFAPINMGRFGRDAIDLTSRDADDNFDPNAALKEDTFGAPDPFMYINPNEANENIKNLLEGAFDDEDETLRPKLRKKRIKVETKAADNLADKLNDLEIKGAKATEDVDEDEEDVGTVDGLNVRLLPHQVDGVAWMSDKESGKRKKNGVLPKGGILADDMGLGKTIQSLALILSNPRLSTAKEMKNSKDEIPQEVGKGTLVVAPLALIRQWESEIDTKVKPSHALKVLVHHGVTRTKRADDLKKYDVVVTTYQTLSSEHAGSSNAKDGPKLGCFGVHWYRVILDEAHTIKNKSAKMTKACYSLRSQYRWCLTGTPMQNNLDELQSLIRFLQIKPYCDVETWKKQIIAPMKNGRGSLAMKRLQFFLKAFMKRRTKDVLKKEGALKFGGKTDGAPEKDAEFKIVGRKIEVVQCELDSDERRFYSKLAAKAESRLQEMIKDDVKDYIGALVLLLRLRQACDHPDLVSMNYKYDNDALTVGTKFGGNGGSQTPRKGEKEADNDMDDLASMLGGMSVKVRRCNVCMATLSTSKTDEGMIRCDDCEQTYKPERFLGANNRYKKSITEKAHKREQKKPQMMKSRNARRLVVDSEDEEEDEDEDGKGHWVVPEAERVKDDMGRTGGTDDENADGAGEWINSDDSESENEKPDLTQSPDVADFAEKRKRLQRKSLPALTDANSVGYDPDTSVRAVQHPKFAQLLHPSSKIKQLIQILERESPDHKVIVFSQFTSMLDLIEPFLEHRKLSYCRYDGSMRNNDREASLNNLRNNPSTRVLLCSLKCGSLGLNLTAASRVVILEPFWNPFVEEQAIDRVHRLNQTVDVVVYRLTVSRSVEERILELQEMKRKLAKVAIEGGDKKSLNKLSMNDILGLFSIDAEHGERFTDRKTDEELRGMTGLLSKFESDVYKAQDGGDDKSNQYRRYQDSKRPVWQEVEAPKRKPTKERVPRVEDPIYGRR